MIKKILQICLGVFFVIVIYLLAVNWLIYYRLGLANLKSNDQQNNYIFNNEATSSSLIYVSLGDSLTAGVGVDDYKKTYPFLIAQKLAGTSTPIVHFNFSYPGAKTENIINDFLTETVAQNPDLITILIGTNDVYGQISKNEFRYNYETIITQLKTQTKAKINIISLPLIGTDSLFLPPFNYYYGQRTLKFNKIIEEIAINNDIHYIDLTTPTAIYTKAISDYYSIDNFHPADLGYRLWAQIIYDNLYR